MRIFDWERFDERERLRVGDEAEQHVRAIISSHGEGVLLRGPLVPRMRDNNQIDGYRETDFLVYTQGSLFCVEVKNYSGVITYLPLKPRGMFHFFEKPTFDDSKILQVKRGKRGEVFQEVYANPLKKTKSFIGLFKRYIGQVEPRFRNLYITPVVCFDERADIRGIYDFQAGMIQIAQLKAFFDHHRNPQFANRPSPWITETILTKVPNWDRVLLLNGEWANGVLTAPAMTVTRLDGHLQTLAQYMSIKAIEVRHIQPGGIHLQLLITFMNGSTQIVECRDAEFQMSRGPEIQQYRLKDLQRLVVGLENKLVRNTGR